MDSLFKIKTNKNCGANSEIRNTDEHVCIEHSHIIYTHNIEKHLYITMRITGRPESHTALFMRIIVHEAWVSKICIRGWKWPFCLLKLLHLLLKQDVIPGLFMCSGTCFGIWSHEVLQCNSHWRGYDNRSQITQQYASVFSFELESCFV